VTLFISPVYSRFDDRPGLPARSDNVASPGRGGGWPISFPAVPSLKASKEETFPEKRQLSVRRRAAIEDSVDGMEV
jgi:hypothetical protein